MKTDWKMALYRKLPIRIQETALSLYARYLETIYYNETYLTWKQWLATRQNWVPSHMEKWKGERLRYILEVASKRVPFYKECYKEVCWETVQSDMDLGILPILDKQMVRHNEYAFLAKDLDKRSLWSEKTSGTTGTALTIYWSKEMAAKWWAIVEVMVRHVAGVGQAMPRATMGGRPLMKGETDHPPFWRYNRRWKQLYLSSYHVSARTSPFYIDALKKYGCEWIYGYGSTIAALAEDAANAGIEPPRLRSIIVSGDTLLPPLRRSIEGYFGCKCYDHYGQSEGVAMAMECGYGRMHVIPQVGIIEILKDDGSRCGPGDIGQVVATSLLNDAMPLVRYRTGDYATWSVERECPCGNPNPIIGKIEGRVDDYLVTPDGRRIGRLSTALKRCPTIHSAQIVQDKPGHAYLLIRPGKGYKSEHGATVRADILERIGRFGVDIVEVPAIPKTPQGKAVLVIRLEERPLMRRSYEEILKKVVSD